MQMDRRIYQESAIDCWVAGRIGPLIRRRVPREVRVVRAILATAAAGLLATTASASFTMTDPGRYSSASYVTLLEARARLDNLGAGSWKTAIWGSSVAAPVATSGNYASDWVSGQAYQFQFDYNVSTGLATWLINNRTVTTTLVLGSGKGLAALQFEARSKAGSFMTAVEGLELSANGGGFASVAGLSSVMSSSGTFVTSGRVYLSQDVTTLSARGTMKFDFQGGTASGDNMRAAVRLLQADAVPTALVPTPGVLGLAAMTLVAVVRRARRA